MIPETIKKNLVCPKCYGVLEEKGEELVCVPFSGQHRYPVEREIPVFLDDPLPRAQNLPNELFMNRLKGWFKKNPFLFRSLMYVLSPVLILDRPNLLLAKCNQGESLILNLGSGTRRFKKNVVNIDLFPYPGVDLVADLQKLPYRNQCVDGIISEYVLEHVPEPSRVIQEMNRIVKPGGYLYVSVPFLIPFHPSPDDYYRWSKNGIRKIFSEYTEVKMGITEGPTGVLNWILQEWFSLLLSFGWEPLYRFWTIFFMIVLFPLKILDVFFIWFPYSHHIAGSMFFLGRKKIKGERAV